MIEIEVIVKIPVQRFTKDSYSEYITNPDKNSQWNKTKRRYQKHFPRRSKYCWICDSTRDLNYHHRSYTRLGRENLRRDIVRLCRYHHTSTAGVHYLHDGTKTPKYYEYLVRREKEIRRKYLLTHIRPSTWFYYIGRYFYRMLP